MPLHKAEGKCLATTSNTVQVGKVLLYRLTYITRVLNTVTCIGPIRIPYAAFRDVTKSLGQLNLSLQTQTTHPPSPHARRDREGRRVVGTAFHTQSSASGTTQEESIETGSQCRVCARISLRRRFSCWPCRAFSHPDIFSWCNFEEVLLCSWS